MIKVEHISKMMWLALATSARPPQLELSFADESQPFEHVWRFTGWCPPDANGTPDGIAKYAMQPASWQSHAWLAAVPHRGLGLVRVHALLNLLTVVGEGAVRHPIPTSRLNVTLLDTALDMVVREHGLSVGFELMGNPRVGGGGSRTGAYTSWRDADQLEGWGNMVAFIVSRYTARYGADVVAQWRFEGWNEPDHGCSETKRMKMNIICDQAAWLGYMDACARGVRKATPPTHRYVWGGPGSGGATATSWVLPAFLDHIAAEQARTGAYPVDFLQWHEKGTNTSAVDFELVERIQQSHPAIAAALPVGNEEADAEGGWSKVLPWRADARGAAADVRTVATHLKYVQDNPRLPNVTLGYLANDAAFLNYGDAWFEQRTFVARFEYNETNGETVGVEVIHKPTLSTMGLMALLGDRRHRAQWRGGTLLPSNDTVGAIASTREGGACARRLSCSTGLRG